MPRRGVRRTMSSNVLQPRPSRGSWFRIERDGNGTLVVEGIFPSTAGEPWQRWLAVLRLVLVSWAVLPVCMVFTGALVGMLHDPRFPRMPISHWEFFIASVVGLTVFAACALHAWIVQLPVVLLEPQPERLVISTTHFLHRPGRFCAEDEFYWDFTRRIARDAVREIRLERSARGIRWSRAKSSGPTAHSSRSGRRTGRRRSSPNTRSRRSNGSPEPSRPTGPTSSPTAGPFASRACCNACLRSRQNPGLSTLTSAGVF